MTDEQRRLDDLMLKAGNLFLQYPSVNAAAVYAEITALALQAGGTNTIAAGFAFKQISEWLLYQAKEIDDK